MFHFGGLGPATLASSEVCLQRHRDFFLTARVAVLRALAAGTVRVLPYRLWRPLLRVSLRGRPPLSRPDFSYVEPVLRNIARSDRLAAFYLE